MLWPLSQAPLGGIDLGLLKKMVSVPTSQGGCLEQVGFRLVLLAVIFAKLAFSQ